MAKTPSGTACGASCWNDTASIVKISFLSRSACPRSLGCL
jgi:hypothetical protein